MFHRYLSKKFEFDNPKVNASYENSNAHRNFLETIYFPLTPDLPTYNGKYIIQVAGTKIDIPDIDSKMSM